MDDWNIFGEIRLWTPRPDFSIFHIRKMKQHFLNFSERSCRSVTSNNRLRQSQYPYAVEHYRLRFNKTKRRRPRIPPALLNQPPPLDAKGWSIRINFKLAAYSEYKQELDAAIKYYELAYAELVDLFSSTASLPPRTKRWTEARVLADSISYKAHS